MREERLEELARAADQLSEQVADAAMDLLRATLDEPGRDAAAATKRDKLIGRARSSIEKASRLLRQAAREDEEPQSHTHPNE